VYVHKEQRSPTVDGVFGAGHIRKRYGYLNGLAFVQALYISFGGASLNGGYAQVGIRFLRPGKELEFLLLLLVGKLAAYLGYGLGNLGIIFAIDEDAAVDEQLELLFYLMPVV
jgi:hypothetical protein